MGVCLNVSINSVMLQRFRRLQGVYSCVKEAWFFYLQRWNAVD